MLAWIKKEIEWARVGWNYENYERSLARQYGSRPDFDGECMTQMGPQANVPFWLYLITYHLQEVVIHGMRAIVCHYKGHDMFDTGYGGPETGWDSGECLRCGWSYHHTYY